VALALYTGARKSTALAPTWDRTAFQEPGRQLTKKRRAVVPISEQLLPVLKLARETAESGHVVEYRGRAVPAGLPWSFRRLCERAKLTWVPIDQAADWLATDPGMLRKVYREFDPTCLRSVADSLRL
jgi:integrase